MARNPKKLDVPRWVIHTKALTTLAALRLWGPTENLLRSMNRLRLFVGQFHNRIPSPIYNRVQKQGTEAEVNSTQ